MTEKSPFFIAIDDTARVTFIDKTNNSYWPKWKLLKDCSDAEIAQINLATPHPKYIVLDKDFGDKKINIDEEYEKLKNKLLSHRINNWIADRSRNGFHIFIPTTNLDKIEDIEVQKEIRNAYIREYGCDEAKKSAFTAISLPGRPHFKTNKVCGLIEELDGEIYTIKDTLINIIKGQVQERSKIIKKLEVDKDFKNYFKDDPFWKYLNSVDWKTLPQSCGLNNTIMPNLAIACAKSGKTQEEIEKIMKPLIAKISGYNYCEFLGWLKKAYMAKIDTYNFFQLNTWMKSFSLDKKEVYSTNISLQDELVIDTKTDDNTKVGANKPKFKFYWDSDLDEIQNQKTEWLVESWIPKGDICFMAGKSASFKSTIALHIAYAIASDKLVFNKYKTMPCRVLYINEENSSNIIVSMIKRVKKGLDLQDKNLNKKFGISILENIRMDNKEHLYFLIDFIKRNNIEVIFCDSFARFIGFDENNATEMNKLFNNWKIFRKECNNLTIIALHHHKKGGGKFQQDSRDMLRGSSDIVNNADSIIAIDRKKGSKYIKMSHVKNRSGEEIENKLIILDSGEDKDQAYFYESDKELDKQGAIAMPDKCAENIMEWIEKNKFKMFARKEVPNEIKEKYSNSVITKALGEMSSEGTLNRVGRGPSCKYIVSQLKDGLNRNEKNNKK